MQKGNGKGKRDLASVIARTRCARCGVIGHWARSCTAQVGVQGATGSTQQQHYQNNDRSTSLPTPSTSTTHPQQAIFFTHGAEPDARSCDEEQTNMPVCLSQTSASAGCLLGLKKNEGVIDTGAQSACIGKAAFKDLCDVLSEVHGLKPFELLSTSKVTHGIGGSAKVLGSWNVPVALGKVPGMLTVAVLDDNSIPLLVPISLQRRLGMKLDVVSNQIEWQLLHTKSQGRTLRTGHIACDMLEFPEQGWTVPEFLAVNLCEVVPNAVVISSSDFLHFNRGGSKTEVETEKVDGTNVEGESKSSTRSGISSQQLRTTST
eukprot:611384-Amphidinium_carterae.3